MQTGVLKAFPAKSGNKFSFLGWLSRRTLVGPRRLCRRPPNVLSLALLLQRLLGDLQLPLDMLDPLPSRLIVALLLAKLQCQMRTLYGQLLAARGNGCGFRANHGGRRNARWESKAGRGGQAAGASDERGEVCGACDLEPIRLCVECE